MNDALPGPATSPSQVPVAEQPGWNWRAVSPVDLGCLVVVTGSLAYAYGANFHELYKTWVREPDYSHGFLVLPIALVILFRLWPTQATDQPRVWLPGLILVVASLGLRAWFQERGQNWSETATVLLVITGLGISRLGWRTMRLVWPAFAFLLFWLPLPPTINTALSQPLQAIATKAACLVLRASGLWVMPEGNVIVVGGEQLEVAAACNGLSMLMSLAAAVAATASIVSMAPVKRLVLLATIVPIALVSNILRIAATAWCYYHFGAENGSKYAHDAAGWLMMPTAMALVGLELMLMSWLIVESEESVVSTFGSSYAVPRQATFGEAGR